MKCQICEKETTQGGYRYVNELDAKLWICHNCVKKDRAKITAITIRIPQDLADRLPKRGKSGFIRNLLYNHFASINALKEE